jgi:endonuclease I
MLPNKGAIGGFISLAKGNIFTLRACLFGLCASFMATLLHAQPAGYYDGVYTLRGEALRQALEDIIDGHTRISYDDLRQALPVVHEDPDNASNIILFYSQASILKSYRDGNGTQANDSWNREHMWPRSYLGQGNSSGHPAFSDMYHLLPAYKGVNSARGNKYFDATDRASGRVGHPLAPDTTTDSDSWEPADAQKGWTARAMLYMPTRYSFLTLVNVPDQPVGTSFARMAQLDTMLAWNRRYAPAADELAAMERIFTSYQRNRNPYADYPEFADAVYVAGPSWGAWRLDHFSLAELRDAEVSDDLADPDRDGIANLLERAQYSDPRSAGVGSLTLSVNGNQLEVRFVRASPSTHIAADLSLEASTDLTAWEPVNTSTAATVPIDSTREQVVFFNPLPPTGPRFYRLRAERLLDQ